MTPVAMLALDVRKDVFAMNTAASSSAVPMPAPVSAALSAPAAASVSVDKPARAPRRITAPAIMASKTGAKGSNPRLVMVTAYDAPSAKIAHRAGADMILVGDSLAMVVLGYDDTLQVTTEDMAHHTAAVTRGLNVSEAAGCTKDRPLIVGDLPWMSYHLSTADAVTNAAKLMRAGATCVKLEGGRKRLPVIQAILDAEIPVMGHIGLTPQSVNTMGGFKVQGRQVGAAEQLISDAKALEAAGCFAIVLEAIPDALARVVTESVNIPTIGIGAGPHCDGQVLVWHDLLGLDDRLAPKFVRKYAELGLAAQEAVAAYAADVRSGAFPSAAESYAASSELTNALVEFTGADIDEELFADTDNLLISLYGSSR
jgi:3-methyl-2-oxobutanoate hydroxymethyltransferase